MKLLLASLICSLMISCSGSPSRAFVSCGFSDKSVIVATLLDQQTSQRLTLRKAEIDGLLREMTEIGSARTAVVEPRYVLELFTGSSLQSQKMQVCIDETGEGYFKQGTGQPIMFYSDRLLATVKAIELKGAEQGGGLND